MAYSYVLQGTKSLVSRYLIRLLVLLLLSVTEAVFHSHYWRKKLTDDLEVTREGVHHGCNLSSNRSPTTKCMQRCISSRYVFREVLYPASRKLEIIPVIGRLCFQMKHNCFLLFQTQNTEDIFEQRSSPNNKNKTKQYKTSKNRIQENTNPNVAWYKLISDHYTPSKINLMKKNKAISVKKKRKKIILKKKCKMIN